MPDYHVDAEREAKEILLHGGRGLKRCLGMMIQRHLRIDDGTEPLSPPEAIGTGSGGFTLYQLAFVYGFWGRIDCVYEKVGSDVRLLALDATQGLARIGSPRTAPDAQARAWNRST